MDTYIEKAERLLTEAQNKADGGYLQDAAMTAAIGQGWAQLATAREIQALVEQRGSE